MTPTEVAENVRLDILKSVVTHGDACREDGMDFKEGYEAIEVGLGMGFYHALSAMHPKTDILKVAHSLIEAVHKLEEKKGVRVI